MAKPAARRPLTWLMRWRGAPRLKSDSDATTSAHPAWYGSPSQVLSSEPPLANWETSVEHMRRINRASTAAPAVPPSVRRAQVDNDTGRPSCLETSITRSATMYASANSAPDAPRRSSADGTQPAGAVVAGSARNPPPMAVPAKSATAPTSSSRLCEARSTEACRADRIGRATARSARIVLKRASADNQATSILRTDLYF
eukprot:scaffold5209_cov106-Isochrysis_galbana.AAC.2